MYPNRRRDIRPSPLAALALPLLLLPCAGPASGQTSAELTVVSTYSARGMALGTRPAPQLRVDHDADGGWYAGAFASPVTLDWKDQGQLIAYGGRAQRLTSTLSWDAGFTRSVFTRYGWYDYSEFYAGLTTQRASLRLFYSPDYYHAGRSVYLDAGNGWPLGEHLRLTLHAGALHMFDVPSGVARNSVDTRVALATEVGDVSLQFGWQRQWHPYLRGTSRARALSASASLHF